MPKPNAASQSAADDPLDPQPEAQQQSQPRRTARAKPEAAPASQAHEDPLDPQAPAQTQRPSRTPARSEPESSSAASAAPAQGTPEASPEAAKSARTEPVSVLYTRREVAGEWKTVLWLATTSDPKRLEGKFAPPWADDAPELRARAYLNERTADRATGEIPIDPVTGQTKKYINLRANLGTDAEPRWETIAMGNAVNHRADGKPVRFNEVIFNFKTPDGEELALRVYTTRDAPREVREAMGFAQDMIPREKREQPEHEAQSEKVAQRAAQEPVAEAATASAEPSQAQDKRRAPARANQGMSR
ncbi:hypothetical protein BX589_101124 [Paraburkholderia fungorum]|uniref:hypothetical protein n=1 Tax=Paraburkholderia fungorum TaxID=134537 RepID=UPI000D0566BA|nr:hypothetical protein [Paraburkholderia fungorum]PRZ56474.1 hypothetical protein BX589_101124 [Paraburkholderia fungorum]